jgi:hypothetical protein
MWVQIVALAAVGVVFVVRLVVSLSRPPRGPKG